MIKVTIKSDSLDRDIVGHLNTEENVAEFVEKHVSKHKLYTYETVTEDLSMDATHIKNKRKSEYPTLEEILHVILDHGLDSTELTELQALRQSIKDKYPLE